ncbi:hypothetical protein, partial [Planococcus wigleyi]
VKSEEGYLFDGKINNEDLAEDSIERKILYKHLGIDEQEHKLKRIFMSPEENKTMDEKLLNGYIDKGSVFNEGANVYLYDDAVINNKLFPEFNDQKADIYGNKTIEYRAYQKELEQFIDNVEDNIIPDLEESFAAKEKRYTFLRTDIDESLKLVDRCKNLEQLHIVKSKFDLETELREIQKEKDKEQDLSL